MLEKVGIDFVVLEAYPEIAPQVGASIGMLPNGLRVLDQLGCYPAIRALIEQPNNHSRVRGPDGKVLSEYNNTTDQFRMRFGYDVIFVDRQMVLQTLYDHLESKDKILTSKRVVDVTLQGSGVKVVTADGESFTGDVLIGADGIHSTVRDKMWRLADTLEPGYIPASEHTAMPCDYKCIFGISVLKSFEPRSTNSIFHKNFSYLVISGPQNRVYWFLFVNLGKTHYGPEIPRFNKKQEEELAKEHWNDKVSEDTTFGDLYEARISSVLTALPEYVFEKWHFRRIMTIGDAAHKFEPISGQGGNSAIETAAVLVNNLTRMMKSHPQVMSDADITSVFAETQKLRSPRAWELVKASHKQQTVEAMETPLLEFLAKYYIPTLSIDSKLDSWTNSISKGAHRLEMLDVPKRFRFIPFTDELPSKPLGTMLVPRLFAAVVFGLLFRIAQQALQLSPDSFSATFLGGPLKQTYTGISTVDLTLSMLVSAFSGGVAGSDPNQRLQCVYFMVMLIPMALVWTVEAYRNGNFRSLVSWPVIFGAAYQLMGIGKIAPLYYLVSLFTSNSPLYTRTTGRSIPASVAKALLPALCIGYVIPTILMFLPYDDLATQQNRIAFWQPFPIYVAALTFGISSLICLVDPGQPLDLELFELKDVLALQAGYAFAFFATAATHISAVFYILANSSTSISEVFFNLPRPGAAWGEVANPVFVFFKYDMLLCFAAVFVWCLYSILELRRTGYITSEQAVKAAAVTTAAQLVVGPGAAYSGVWAWRESVIVQQVKTGK
ncbi:putative fad binding domain protein [Neofusicoccum parvum UCRNP2]|uniref:Putative fad binding domain protein n=1 Tax=Botryosphaeria parva (strain UCR-NP2) TaxID=1287680 RepID=R1GDQ5_BOTPV|nr:putative fad binding domain protein [Neofusicoccum parvum UCRNP2]